jgi:hypothetical protein
MAKDGYGWIKFYYISKMDDDKDQETRRRLLVLFKNHAEMADAYLSQFGTEINMKNIQSVRSQFPGSGDTGSMPAAEAAPEAAPEEIKLPENLTEIVFNFSSKAFEVPHGDPTKESPLYPRVVD